MTKPHLKPIPGFAGYYASSLGEVWSARPGRWGNVRWTLRKPGKGRDGYFDVVLMPTLGRRSVNKPIHILVAMAWLGPRPAHLVTTHLDGLKTNNAPSNLAYRTHRENVMDKKAHGTMPEGAGHPMSRFSDAQVLQMLTDVSGGMSKRDVCRAHGVSESTLWKFRNGLSRPSLSQSIH